jgi:hypothetical protein
MRNVHVVCRGSCIHLEPLTSLQGPETATAMHQPLFFRKHGVQLDSIKMDNQSSPEAKSAAIKLSLRRELVNPNQKEPNRAERATRTAKSHIIHHRHTVGISQGLPAHLFGQMSGPDGAHTKPHPLIRV